MMDDLNEPTGAGKEAEARAFVIAATRFRTGRLYMTPGAKAAFEALPPGSVTAGDLIARHIGGDWGDDLDAQDSASNDRAVRNGDERILSSYTLPEGTKVWIITEADRSSTTLLLPDEY